MNSAFYMTIKRNRMFIGVIFCLLFAYSSQSYVCFHFLKTSAVTPFCRGCAKLVYLLMFQPIRKQRETLGLVGTNPRHRTPIGVPWSAWDPTAIDEDSAGTGRAFHPAPSGSGHYEDSAIMLYRLDI